MCVQIKLFTGLSTKTVFAREGAKNGLRLCTGVKLRLQGAELLPRVLQNDCFRSRAGTLGPCGGQAGPPGSARAAQGSPRRPISLQSSALWACMGAKLGHQGAQGLPRGLQNDRYRSRGVLKTSVVAREGCQKLQLSLEKGC